jgi:hypothetical protein
MNLAGTRASSCQNPIVMHVCKIHGPLFLPLFKGTFLAPLQPFSPVTGQETVWMQLGPDTHVAVLVWRAALHSAEMSFISTLSTIPI